MCHEVALGHENDVLVLLTDAHILSGPGQGFRQELLCHRWIVVTNVKYHKPRVLTVGMGFVFVEPLDDFKGIFEKIILNTFGQFIKGLQKDKLSVDLFGGNFKL